MNEVMMKLFAQEVKEGLSQSPKLLSSKWFYDKKGDELFVKIMGLPEYYLTKCEEEIFEQKTESLISSLIEGVEDFDLLELGAGDGTKTMHLLSALRDQVFTYRPIDISSNAIKTLEERVSKELPDVKVEGLQGEYFEVLSKIKSDKPKVILFMGSNIGNMLDERANDFLLELSAAMNKGDRLLLGVDLIKDESIILPAYNDSLGITAEFNLNLLDRINRELGGNFNRQFFKHTPRYDKQKGVAYSYITSLADQDVRIDALDQSFHFNEGDRVFTEVSRKYDDKALETITNHTSLVLKNKIFDSKEYFCDAIYFKE